MYNRKVQGYLSKGGGGQGGWQVPVSEGVCMIESVRGGGCQEAATAKAPPSSRTVVRRSQCIWIIYYILLIICY